MNQFSLQVARDWQHLRLTVSGRIDEDTDFSRVSWTGIRAATIDLHAVTIFTSIGVKRWLEFTRTVPADVELTLERCSLAVVHQLNILPNFFNAKNTSVTSIYLPYHCLDCDLSVPRLIDLSELPADLNGVEIAPEPCSKCGQALELDAVLPRYLGFLSRTRAVKP